MPELVAVAVDAIPTACADLSPLRNKRCASYPQVQREPFKELIIASMATFDSWRHRSTWPSTFRIARCFGGAGDEVIAGLGSSSSSRAVDSTLMVIFINIKESGALQSRLGLTIPEINLTIEKITLTILPRDSDENAG